MRLAYLVCGILSICVGVISIFLPLLPTVPFMLLAAFCFARSNPEWEARILRDPRFGPHIHAWRQRGAISLKGKIAAIVGLTGSGIMGLVFLEGLVAFAPAAVALICGSWIAIRPNA